MPVQGFSLSDMTSTLQSMDPLHTAYLDWRLFMRNFLAVCVPALPELSAGQLLQLKQRMQQADSNADGLLTQPEWASLDMQPLFMAAAGCVQAEACSSSSAHALAGRPAAEGQQTDVNASSDARCKSDDDVASGEGARSEMSAAQLNDLLCLMFADSNAALNLEEVMLYLCCGVDGAEGLQKVFAVLTGSQSDGQVCLVTRPSKTSGSIVSWVGNSDEASLTCRLMRTRSTGCLILHMLK